MLWENKFGMLMMIRIEFSSLRYLVQKMQVDLRTLKDFGIVIVLPVAGCKPARMYVGAGGAPLTLFPGQAL